MGFFYQAIKKATGQPVIDEETAVIPPPSEEPPAPVKSASSFAVASPATVAVPVAAPAKPRRTFSVKHPLANLVAFLAPPVLQPNVVAMEQCRIIRTRLRETMRTRKIRNVMMTSAMPSEGKTLLSVNLAYALSQLENNRVLLVDGDLRHPSVGNFLKMPAPAAGLASYLTAGDSFDDVVVRITPTLDVVPTSQMATDSPEVLQGARMHQFLAEAASRYDMMLMDGPPIFPIVDAQVLTGIVEGVVLAVRAHSTPYDMAYQAADIVKSKLVGTVLNCVDHLSTSTYYGKYGYGYGTPVKGKEK